jgi:hypothetical protein
MFYEAKSPKGYIDYPFCREFLEEMDVKKGIKLEVPN